MRRKCEIVDDIAFVVAANNAAALQEYLLGSGLFSALNIQDNTITGKVADTLPVTFYLCSPKEFWPTLFRTTGKRSAL